MRLLLLFVCSLCLVGAPAFAQGSALAEPFGEPLILYAADHLPFEMANPAVVTHPDAGAIAASWPEEVTLQAYVFGAPTTTTTRRVLLIGGIHGDEAVSYLVPQLLIGQLMQEAEYQKNDGLLQALVDHGTQLYIVPLVNPYGTLAGLRTNFRRPTHEEGMLDALGDEWETRPEWWLRRRGVDLNRNFPVNLANGGSLFARPDGEGTHDWDAPGGCHQLELYYGGLLDWNETQPEPANVWLHGLIQAITPQVTIALHQEARVMYVDSSEPAATAVSRWAPFLEAMHAAFNAPVTDARGRVRPGEITFGIRADGTRIDPEACVNDFSPGGYGAALSLFSGVVLTLEMTDDQSDAETDACWFPEGMLSTYSHDLALTEWPPTNLNRLDTLLSRFRGPLLYWLLALDPACPDQFVLPGDHQAVGSRLLLPMD